MLISLHVEQIFFRFKCAQHAYHLIVNKCSDYRDIIMLCLQESVRCCRYSSLWIIKTTENILRPRICLLNVVQCTHFEPVNC